MSNVWGTFQYRDFNAKLFLALKDKEDGYVAELDIANFYDSINLDVLKRKVVEKFDGSHADEIALLFHFLQYWNKYINHYNPQTVGLPQDVMSDCSRILANFYLQEYDIYIKTLCDEVGAKYFRYADDQMFIVEDDSVIEHILYKASRKLTAMGLSINQKKVKINSVKEVIEHRSFELFDILFEPKSNKDPEKSQQFITELIKILESDVKEKLKAKGVPLLRKALSCNWKKVAYSQKVKLLSWYLDDDYLKFGRRYQFIAIYNKLSTNEEKDDLISAIDRLSETLIHNAFHYEILAFYQSIGKKYDHIQDRIEELKVIYAN